MYKYILFDWDGTLAKTLDVWLNTYKEIFLSEGLFPTDAEIVVNAFGQREKGMENIGSKNPSESWDKVVARVNSEIQDVPLYENATEVIAQMKIKNMKLALLTQSDKATVMPAIDKNQLAQYFDIILTKDDVVNKKPDPEIFLKALDKLGASKSETLVVGDSHHDILGGKNAGIDTVVFYPKENEKFYSILELKKGNPKYFIADLNELLRIVK